MKNLKLFNYVRNIGKMQSFIDNDAPLNPRYKSVTCGNKTMNVRSDKI